ncbi:deoxyribose-phosphate aldolase [Limosilactobacillus equigenerosi]|uniref:Deoxyribose-phosphate aldolase n=1 Tax=Limosilactobacillus equigenerosi DSM 18793 = JCM 14505 TaxID=1423742 RepID=A0A0R1UT03_9LACO|nr:deoxyribose-phosphate aldolase [Limosilactobacillus equigenerosi]KRL96320.1 deoxyribose-phosphate aldolase [Limosilactobacillus equigenerosi DSM 18793 = JCM 14505]MCQ2570336.1 deoxyribose-phosphate aldolase [Limosilactobacillus sp.]
MSLTVAELAKYMDHTLLKPEATEDQIEQTIQEAIKYNTASVCVNPYWVKKVHDELEGTTVNTCTVVGFPLGATSTQSKVDETKTALKDGADEIDMVINIGELKAGHDDAVQADIKAVADATHEGGKLLKVIIETALLTDEEKTRASKLTVAGDADFVKTSTGFSTSGAKAEDVKLMREAVGPDFKIKAAGGMHSLADALSMIDAGADRLGVSASVQILEEAKQAWE